MRLATESAGERLCPGCGYDLRGGASGELVRCPECGKRWTAAETTSRIPWERRRGHGAGQAYLATVWMVLVHGKSLGQQMRGRVRRREAERFARVSVWLGIVLGMGAVGACYGIVWAYGGTGVPPFLRVDAADAWFRVPWLAALDGRVMLAGAIVWLWASLWAIVAFGRFTAWGLQKDRGVRRRGARLAWYLAGMLPVMVVLLGGASVLWTLPMNSLPGTGWFKLTWMGCVGAAWVVAMRAVGLFLAGIGVGQARGLLGTVLYPPTAVALAVGLLGVVAWAAGWAGLALYSMMV